MMMYPFSEFKTEAPTSWADPYGGIAAAGVSPEILQTTFNSSRTPDSTDSYAYPTHNGGNGYYPNQYPTNQHTPHYYQQQQQQQQQQQSYYSSEQYYQSNGVNPYVDQRQSPEYYQNVSPPQQQQQQQQQQYDYNAYHTVNGGQWHQSATSDYVDHHLRQQQQQLQQQQQTPFIKSESVYNSVAKTEIFDHAQQQQQIVDTGACVENGSSSTGSSSNFFYDNYQECELSPVGSVVSSNSSGRLPPMSHFGFTPDPNYKMEQQPLTQQQQQQQSKSNFGFANEVKPVKAESNSVGRITDHMKEKKKSRAATKRMMNRFNGMSEEEVAKRGLPDYLREGLDIVFIGINPSMFAAYTGKYYDGPGNHFWQALHLSGLLPELMCADDDHKLLDLGIGFTNIVARTTRGLSDLSRAEIAEGAKILREKLMRYRPKIAVFNGKAIYEVYSGQKKFMFGRQPEPIVSNEGGQKTWLWVMPSSSARCAQLPRAVDKVPFFDALRKYRDHLSGRLPQLDMCEIVFANVTLRNQPRKIKTEQEQEQGQQQQQHQQQQHQQRSYFSPPQRYGGGGDQFVDYTRLEPWTDGRPAQVPPSVDAVIESVIRKYGSPDNLGGRRHMIDDLDDVDDDEEDDLDFKDEDSNGICDMNFKEEDMT